MFIARGMHQITKAPEGRQVAAGGVRRFIGALTRFLPLPTSSPPRASRFNDGLAQHL